MDTDALCTQDLGATDVPKWSDFHFKYRHHCPQEGQVWLWEEVGHKKREVVQFRVNRGNWPPTSPPPTGADMTDPSPVICRALGPQGSLGPWWERVEMVEKEEE